MSFNGAYASRGTNVDVMQITKMPSSVRQLNAMMLQSATPLGSTYGGVRVILPSGTLTVDTAIKIPGHVILEGQGPSTVLLAGTSMTGAMVTNYAVGDRRFGIRNLTIYGASRAVTGISFDTPLTTGNEYADGMWRISDMDILSCGTDGIVVSGRGEGKAKDIFIRDAGRYGIDINSIDNDFLSVTVGNAGQAGVVVRHSNNRLENTKVYYTGYTSTTAPHGFWLDGATNGAVIATLTNCEAQDCTGHGFYVNRFDHVDLNGCVADSNGAGHSSQSYTGHGFVFNDSDYGQLRGRARDRNANATRQQRGLLISGWTSVLSVDLMASGNQAGSTSNTTGNTISGRVNGVVGNIS